MSTPAIRKPGRQLFWTIMDWTCDEKKASWVREIPYSGQSIFRKAISSIKNTQHYREEQSTNLVKPSRQSAVYYAAHPTRSTYCYCVQHKQIHKLILQNAFSSLLSRTFRCHASVTDDSAVPQPCPLTPDSACNAGAATLLSQHEDFPRCRMSCQRPLPLRSRWCDPLATPPQLTSVFGR